MEPVVGFEPTTHGLQIKPLRFYLLRHSALRFSIQAVCCGIGRNGFLAENREDSKTWCCILLHGVLHDVTRNRRCWA